MGITKERQIFDYLVKNAHLLSFFESLENNGTGNVTYRKDDVAIDFEECGWVVSLSSPKIEAYLEGDHFEVSKGSLSDFEELFESLTENEVATII